MSVSATMGSPPMDFRLNELQPMLFAKSVHDALSRFQSARARRAWLMHHPHPSSANSEST